MLSLFSLSRRQAPIYLALLAMTMLFVAPVISKSLEHQRASQLCAGEISTAEMATSGMAAMHHAMPGMEHATCETEQRLPHHLLPSIGSSPMEDIACGYCQLLIHLALIQTVFIPFIWLIVLVSQQPYLPARVSPCLIIYYSEYQPRAPPSTNFLY